MKIAVPTRGNKVEGHYGHSEVFTVFTLEGNAIITTDLIPSPDGCGCKSNIAAILKQEGVSVLLAGNMGDGALINLTNHQIQVIRGCEGDAHNLVQAFIDGKIVDSGELCKHHDHQHGSSPHVNGSCHN